MKQFTIFFISIFIVACGSNQPKSGGSDNASSSHASKPANASTVYIQANVPYSKDNRIASNIKNECGLNTVLPNYMIEVGNIKRAKNLKKNTKGKVLIMQITDAVSSGNAFTGHRKAATVKGVLYNNGKKIGDFTAMRVSGGGMWGAYKGSCSVLNRIMKVVSKDIANWLTSPSMGARLGDA